MRNRNVDSIVAGICRRTNLSGGESERLAAVVMHVLPELSLEERMLLRFHFGAGLSVADTARLLGAPKRSVGQRIDALLRRLRETGKNAPVRHTERVEIRA